MIKHPAKYTDSFIPIFADIIRRYKISSVLDVFGGTGKIGKVKKLLDFDVRIVSNDIEQEWAMQGKDNGCDDCLNLDAENLETVGEGSYDSVITSPTYGNGMASKSPGAVYTYTKYLGRALDPENTGGVMFGKNYKDKHLRCLGEIKRVIKKQGILVLNLKNFYARGTMVDLVGWWKCSCESLGFSLLEEIKVPTKGYGIFGNKLVGHEHILVYSND